MHAVARELEYEVFEVFPGMGRRGAKDLERYVGDVGRNHVVLGGSPRKGGNVAAMFQRMQAKAETGASGAKGTEKAVNGGADDARKAGDTDKGPTQSLILVDEVDVLFKGEEDFWQGACAGTFTVGQAPVCLTDGSLDTAHRPHRARSAISPADRHDLHRCVRQSGAGLAHCADTPSCRPLARPL